MVYGWHVMPEVTMIIEWYNSESNASAVFTKKKNTKPPQKRSGIVCQTPDNELARFSVVQKFDFPLTGSIKTTHEQASLLKRYPSGNAATWCCKKLAELNRLLHGAKKTKNIADTARQRSAWRVFSSNIEPYIDQNNPVQGLHAELRRTATSRFQYRLTGLRSIIWRTVPSSQRASASLW